MVDDVLAVAKCSKESLEVNTYVNAQIELKKLKFHRPDKDGKTKCHVIHVGPKNPLCPQLQVHGTPMKKVTEDTYLGDIISEDGKHTKTLQSRISRGLGIINQIMNVLKNVSFGKHFFKIAILLRDSLFLNGILTNMDIWYSFGKKQVKQLEDLDLILLRKFLNTPFSVPSEAVY